MTECHFQFRTRFSRRRRCVIFKTTDNFHESELAGIVPLTREQLGWVFVGFLLHTLAPDKTTWRVIWQNAWGEPITNSLPEPKTWQTELRKNTPWGYLQQHSFQKLDVLKEWTFLRVVFFLSKRSSPLLPWRISLLKDEKKPLPKGDSVFHLKLK